MNILLICPLTEDFSNIVGINNAQTLEAKKNLNKTYKKVQLFHPVGLLSIAAYTIKHKDSVNIKVLDFNIMIGAYLDKFCGGTDEISRELFWEYCLSEADGFIPDLIGISALFCTAFYELNPFADFCRKKYMTCLITCG
jgi:hypothetical protein